MSHYIPAQARPASANLPGWVPPGAQHYIAHTENGLPIRALARAAGCHASTILRQIRKIEMRRDDPLVDAALRKLGHAALPHTPSNVTTGPKETRKMTVHPRNTLPDEATLSREAMRILRRLCETGAVLAVAADMEKAVVVRDTPSGGAARTAVVDTAVAQAMALKDWIAAGNAGRIIRYHITAAGRTALGDFIARSGPLPEPFDGMAEEAAGFDHADLRRAAEEETETAARNRLAIGESPLAALSRRRNKDGSAFLGEALVHAGERLREDFEVAQMESGTTQNWDHFLTAGAQTSSRAGAGGAQAPARARQRVQEALQALGPGLSDVALRCCCYLEGLETTEKRLGWSARSGKVVLRIALMRLKRHYDDTLGPGGALIG